LAINYTFNDNEIRRGATLCNKKNFLLRTIPPLTLGCSSPEAHELISGIYLAFRSLPGQAASAVSILASAPILAGDILAGVFFTAL